MDWDELINVNRTRLLGMVAAMFVTLDVTLDALFVHRPLKITRAVRISILRLLRPVEASARRLVYAHYQRLIQNAETFGGALRPVPRKPQKALPAPRQRDALHAEPLQLYDAVKHYGMKPQRKRPRGVPRVMFPLSDGFVFTPVPIKVPPGLDDLLDPAPLIRRLAGLRVALGDLGKQAQRLARIKQRRLGKNNTPIMRLGLPPGQKMRMTQDVHIVLHTCDQIARDLQSSPDLASGVRAPP